MLINQHTKISAVLKQHPDALEAIVSISEKFEKLRNPLLRKLMAGRASIAMASKVAGCSVADIFARLVPLGFKVDAAAPVTSAATHEMPAFTPDQIVELDVRPVLASGKDPLDLILQQIKTLQPGQVLKIINTFEPTPLIVLLEKQGFASRANHISEELVETWFYKNKATIQPTAVQANWDETYLKYSHQLYTIDVRHLEMPLPMMTILESLDVLPENGALFVYHKRLPVFLLPELAQRNMGYCIKEINKDEVHLLIFSN